MVTPNNEMSFTILGVHILTFFFISAPVYDAFKKKTQYFCVWFFPTSHPLHRNAKIIIKWWMREKNLLQNKKNFSFFISHEKIFSSSVKWNREKRARAFRHVSCVLLYGNLCRLFCFFVWCSVFICCEINSFGAIKEILHSFFFFSFLCNKVSI